ncbi:MAG TPA: CPBP family intramembrane glutamic endopeptidase [Sedimentisphaerales bacterium]|nr:CPBP family intramembrane glutamic endopeptidase [Sedimentisphaerales bacterium]
MEFTEHITIEHIICLLGLIILTRWLLKTSLGRKALADSVPRRNNMPVYLPFVPLFICFGTVSLTASITHRVFGDLQGWESNFLDNLIICISELMAIVVIIFLARVHFARRLKGFGLNVKTIVKDFFAAFVNLLTVWPLITAAILLTIFFGEQIWGQEYQMQQHQQIKLITEYPQLPLRIMIFIVAVVIASLFEEMLFRGLFQTTIRSYFEARFRSPIARGTGHEDRVTDRYGAWVAILISSGLFAATHADTGHWPALFVLGMCLGYAYEKSGSLFRPIFIHSLFNATSIIATLNQ